MKIRNIRNLMRIYCFGINLRLTCVIIFTGMVQVESGCRLGEKCSFAHRQVEEQPCKRSEKNGDKSAVACEAAWRLAKSVLKLKEKNKAAFFSPSENRCLPASTLKLEEREFVVDSGASLHMISKKDLNSAEMDILTKSCSPTIVITANGEVQTHEEATVYVKELDIFLTMKVFGDTPTVLSLGKLCD